MSTILIIFFKQLFDPFFDKSVNFSVENDNARSLRRTASGAKKRKFRSKRSRAQQCGRSFAAERALHANELNAQYKLLKLTLLKAWQHEEKFVRSKRHTIYSIYTSKEKRNLLRWCVKKYLLFCTKIREEQKMLSKTIKKRPKSKNASQTLQSVDGFVKKRSNYLYILHTNFSFGVICK